MLNTTIKLRDLADFPSYAEALDRQVRLQVEHAQVEREIDAIRHRRRSASARREAQVEALMRGDEPTPGASDSELVELERRRSLLLEALERQRRVVDDARAQARAVVAEEMAGPAGAIYARVAEHLVGLAKCFADFRALEAATDTGATPPVAVPLSKFSLSDPASYAHHALAEIERHYGVKVPARRKALAAIEKSERAEAEERERRRRGERATAGSKA